MPAKKTTAKKTTAKKAATKTTAAEQTAAEQTAAEQTAAVNRTVKTIVDELNALVEDASDRVEDAVEVMVRVARDVAHTYVGTGLVLQDKLARRDFAMVDYRTFLDEAKTKGHAQIADIQSRIEPIAAKVNETVSQAVEPITERFESTLPQPVKDALEAGRERMRTLVNA